MSRLQLCDIKLSFLDKPLPFNWSVFFRPKVWPYPVSPTSSFGGSSASSLSPLDALSVLVEDDESGKVGLIFETISSHVIVFSASVKV